MNKMEGYVDADLYVHSRCCNKHWELVLRNGKASLECEECGRPAGSQLTVSITNVPQECEECQKD